MRGNLSLSRVSWLRVFNSAKVEVSIIFLQVKVEGELIHASDVELTAKGLNVATWVELVSCVVVVSHILQAWLSHLEVTRKSLSLHQKSKVIAAIVRVVHFSNFNRIICQEVVNDEGQLVKAGIETKHSSVVIKELLLALHSATTKGLFHVLFEAWISEFLLGDLLLCEAVVGNRLRLTLSLAKILYL